MAKGLVLLLTLGITSVALGQTSADLAAKYRQITSYEVRPNVVMTPKYAADGKVCEMVLERRQKTDKGIVFTVSFSEEEVQQLVDELAPEAERGRNLTRHLNTTVDGGFITTEYTYENVLVHVYGITRPAPAGDRVITVNWPKRGCGGAQASATSETLNVRDHAMGIFKEMYEQRSFVSDRDYWELRRMLSEAISRGYVEQVPVMKPNRFSPGQEWFRDKETGEIYSLHKPDEKNRGLWSRVDAEDVVEPGERVQ